MNAFCQKNGIFLQAYSPFGNPGRPWAGTAKDGLNNTQVSLLEHPTIQQIGKKHGKGAGHVLLRFQVQRNIIPLTKSVNPKRIHSNIQVFDFQLDSGDMKEIESLQSGIRILPLSWDGLVNHKDYPFKDEINENSVL